MRILYHHRTLADGAEGIHIAAMVDAFRDLGHAVHVDGEQPGTVSARHRWIARLRDAVPRGCFEAAAVAYNGPEFVRVLRAIDLFRPDAVYARHGRYGIGALAAAAARRVPDVLEVNALFTDADYRQFEPLALTTVARHLERRALTMARLVVAVSTPLARKVEQLADRPAVVLPNGADVTRFDPSKAHPTLVRERYGIGQRLVIGWSGILRGWHGVEALIDALPRLPEAVLLLVGDGPARSLVEERARLSGVRDRTVFAGRVPHEAMPDHLAAFDVAVVADDRTGMACPMKLLEYMAMGCTVVAPRRDNILDVVEDGETGLLFDAERADGLADALCRAAADGVLRRAVGRRARCEVAERRNWRSNAEAVLQRLEGRL